MPRQQKRGTPVYENYLTCGNFLVKRLSLLVLIMQSFLLLANMTSLDIDRVPTFIIYKNNIEAGRIIENPITSLEQDMVNILTGMKINK